MSNDYTVKSVIICDDVRQEVSGKEILIGVYNDTIVVGQLPASLLKFVVRISVKATRQDFKQFTVQIVDHAGGIILDAKQDFVLSGEYNLIFGVQIGNLTFTQLGKHEILFGLDQSPTKIGEFDVRLPSNAEEQNRLKSA